VTFRDFLSFPLAATRLTVRITAAAAVDVGHRRLFVRTNSCQDHLRAGTGVR